MLGQQFYHETMRKVVVAFGSIFNNINLVRKNNDGTKAVVKYSGAQPSFLNGKTTYTHAEILVEMSTEDWLKEI